MSRIWTPGDNSRFHPGEWDPKKFYHKSSVDEAPPHLKLLGDKSGPEHEKQETVTVKVINATYHKEQGYIALQVGMPNGSARAVVLSKESFTFGGGRKHSEVEKDFVDKQMEKTADLFRRRIGNNIRLSLYESQLQ